MAALITNCVFASSAITNAVRTAYDLIAYVASVRSVTLLQTIVNACPYQCIHAQHRSSTMHDMVGSSTGLIP
jgi:hypothetical protein